MLVSSDLDRFVVFNNREQTLVGKMGKEEFQSVEYVEEGEISDSTSVEEISEEDFNNQEVVKVSGNSNIPDKPRVWTMRDLYKYPISQNYASGLYNLAWAQAVQNKPLDDILVKPIEDNSNLKQSSLSSSLNGKEQNKINNGGSGSLNSSSMKEANNKVIIDVSCDEDEDAKLEDVAEGEKEEGELEEGEIDLDSEVVQRVEDEDLEGNDEDSMKLDTDVNENELEKRVNSIREELETVTKRNAEK